MAVAGCDCPKCAPRQPDGALTYFPARGGLEHRESLAKPDMTVRFLPVEPLPFREARQRGLIWPAWMFHHDRGIGYVRFHGWGVQWRDTRTNPPSAGTRAQWTKIGIGPYLLRLLRP